MAKRGAYIAAGIAAFLVFLVAMLPASQVAGRLPPDIVLEGAGGTIWSGHARALSVQGRPLGAAEWSCRPWRLLLLEWSCRLSLRPTGGEVSGDLSGDFGGEIFAREVHGSLPISCLRNSISTACATARMLLARGAARSASAVAVSGGSSLHARQARLRPSPRVRLLRSPHGKVSRRRIARAEARVSGGRIPLLSQI